MYVNRSILTSIDNSQMKTTRPGKPHTKIINTSVSNFQMEGKRFLVYPQNSIGLEHASFDLLLPLLGLLHGSHPAKRRRALRRTVAGLRSAGTQGPAGLASKDLHVRYPWEEGFDVMTAVMT